MGINDELSILTKAEVGEDRLINKDEENIKNQIDLLYRIGFNCAITDAAIVTGGKVGEYSTHSRGNACTYYFRMDEDDGIPHVVNDKGVVSFGYKDTEQTLRPVLRNPSFFDSLDFFESKVYFDTLSTFYGEYINSAVSLKRQKILERAYIYGMLSKTNKDYHVMMDKKIVAYPEYCFNGKKYVRIMVNNPDGVKLSNGGTYQNGEFVWLNVEPISWLVCPERRMLISECGILAGIIYDDVRPINTVFEKTYMYRFMNDVLKKDFIPSKIIDYNFVDESKLTTPENIDKFSEEDIIRGAIESDIPVFLHGDSADGKSSRIKELDPNCEVIYLANATIDSFLGKSVYNQDTNQMIDVKPTWLVNLENKCEMEPDKIHILFFDELSNASPSVQGHAFNVVLDKEVNGKWKLPKNVRIAAAGNEKEESKTSRGLSEPMFNRFAHVYIKTTVNNWLAWASGMKSETETLTYSEESFKYKIHPLIFSFISYKALMNQDVLHGVFDGKKPNANPRKWEMASKMLEKTNNPYLLRALIGEDNARDLAEFDNKCLITIDDIINKRYSEEVYNMDLIHKYSTISKLCEVDEDNYQVVRDFVLNLGSGVVSTFDIMWANGMENRLEMVMMQKMMDEEGRGL